MIALSFRKFVVLLSLFIALCIPCFVQAQMQPTRADYDAHWIDAAQALTTFANADLSQARPNPSELTMIYHHERERYANALIWLAQRLPPPEVTLEHWELLPLHEQVLAAMTLVYDASKRNDEAEIVASWGAFRNAVNLLRSTTERLMADRK